MLKDLYDLYDLYNKKDDYNASLYIEREQQAIQDMLEFNKDGADYGKED